MLTALAIILLIADVAVIVWAIHRGRIDAVGVALMVIGAVMTWLAP